MIRKQQNPNNHNNTRREPQYFLHTNVGTTLLMSLSNATSLILPRSNPTITTVTTQLTGLVVSVAVYLVVLQPF